jgi:hypothetical protein
MSGIKIQISSDDYNSQTGSYTCPAGKTFVGKGVLSATAQFASNGNSNPTASIGNFRVVGVSMYRYGGTVSDTAMAAPGYAELPVILQAGQSVSATVTGNNGVASVWLCGVES